ncbi:MAG: methionyl-tRNA formyltransferase [Lachnospiraceae bacterium]|jgi:methionyl-tRNA formyltransferase
MKIVFFGTPNIAAAILKRLIESEHEVIALVTQPDRGSGRGKAVQYSPAKKTALAADIPVLQPERVSDEAFLEELRALNADLHVVAAYAQKIPNAILEMTPLGCINVHPSLLPRYRGATPLNAAILNGDDVSGVTVMKMAEEMDAGDILLQGEIRLSPTETVRTLEQKAIELGGELLLETIKGLRENTIRPVKQDDTLSTYVKQIRKEDGRIDFAALGAAVIERMIRAYEPWPGTYTYLDGKVFKIQEATVMPSESEALPGQVVFADKECIGIQTAEGILVPTVVQLEGKKSMAIGEFLRGKKIEQGYIFG